MNEDITMAADKRDDTGLRSLICPHCKQTLPVLQIQAFEQQQLVYMKCGLCGEGITKKQIDETYREYAAKSLSISANDVSVWTERFPPHVGMESLVGVTEGKFPLSFGNYCSIAGGPYLCNFWSENLREWARRNPEAGDIEVTIVEHNGNTIGFVSDERMKDWCNDRLCVTGHGWPSVAVMKKVCELLGFDAKDMQRA